MISLPTGTKNHNSGNKKSTKEKYKQSQTCNFWWITQLPRLGGCNFNLCNDTNDKRFITNRLVLWSSMNWTGGAGGGKDSQMKIAGCWSYLCKRVFTEPSVPPPPPPPLSVWTYAITTKYGNKHVRVGWDNFWGVSSVTKIARRESFPRVRRENGWIVSWNKTEKTSKRESFLKFIVCSVHPYLFYVTNAEQVSTTKILNNVS